MAGVKQQVSARTGVKQQRQKDNPLTMGLVSLLTESLRVLGVGKERYAEVAQLPSSRPLRRGDVAGVVSRLRADYKRAYFVTGLIDDSIYEQDCYFADPTVAFSGLNLWKRNLALLVPFLIRPSVKLTGLKRMGRAEDGREVLRAEWVLETYLALPWKPFISIGGATQYTLNEDANKVEEHVEFWSVSGTEAVLQIFKPSGAKV